MNKRLACVMLACGVMLALSAPAQAHVYIAKRSPGKGATVSSSVGSVKAVLTGQLIAGKLKVTKSSSGAVVASGGLADSRTVRATIGHRLARGAYKVKLSVTAGDAHKQTFTWGFTVG